MITVLQLCEHFGGKEASLHGVARGFQWWFPLFDKKRFRVLLCSRKARDKAAEQMEQAGLEPLYLGYGKMDPRNLSALIKLVRQEDVDIIHAHGYGACTWGRIAGQQLSKPVIVHERCNTVTVPWFQRPVEWWLGKRTRYALAVSESSRQFCIHKRYMAPDVVEVLYNGIPLDNIEIADAQWIREFRASRGCAGDERVVGIVGRLESHKGHLDAFRALEKLLVEMPQVRLWVAGDGTYANVLHSWVKERGLGDKIDFLGFRKDVRRVIQCFDVQLFPSHMEGTPNTLYEAMAVGNAVVASTADGQGEILADNDTALMFVPGEVEVMEEQLFKVLHDDALRERLRRRSRERSADFDGRKTIEKMQALYERIMQERGATPSSQTAG